MRGEGENLFLAERVWVREDDKANSTGNAILCGAGSPKPVRADIVVETHSKEAKLRRSDIIGICRPDGAVSLAHSDGRGWPQAG